MLSGSMIDVNVASGVTINGTAVASANILATNGIIHVVDDILLP